jgi:hypothetical protein
MAGDKRPESDLPGRPERPSPTIELTATEIPEPRQEATPAPGAPPDPPVPGEAAAPGQPAATSAEPSEPVEPAPAAEGPSGPAAWRFEPEPEPGEAPPPGPPEPPADVPGPERRSVVPALAAGAGAGIGASLLVLLGLWGAGALSPPAPRTDPALDQRIAALDARLRELAARPAPVTDSKPVEDLAARLARLESAAASAPPAQPGGDPALAGRIAEAETSAKSAADAVAALERRLQELMAATRDARTRADAAAEQAKASQDAVRTEVTAERGELDALAGRIAALEQQTKALADLNGRIAGLERETKSLAEAQAKREAEGAVDRAVRRALAGVALREAVERGDGFAAELAALKPFVPDAQRLAPLEPFAAAGVPGARSLANELLAIIPTMARTADPGAREGGFLDRLQASAERLVRIRPVGEAQGDDAAATLARVEARARQADLAGALAELEKLPEAVRAPAQAWMGKARAQLAAVDASQKLSTEAVAGLKS